MTHSLSRINVLLSIAIIVLIAGWLGLVERRMHYANIVGQLEVANKELKGSYTAQELQFTVAVAKENRALLSEGILQKEESPVYVYRGSGAGVALAGRGR